MLLDSSDFLPTMESPLRLLYTRLVLGIMNNLLFMPTEVKCTNKDSLPQKEPNGVVKDQIRTTLLNKLKFNSLITHQLYLLLLLLPLMKTLKMNHGDSEISKF